jgi:hypothetical protein
MNERRGGAAAPSGTVPDPRDLPVTAGWLNWWLMGSPSAVPLT